jgi:hypothetical protein
VNLKGWAMKSRKGNPAFYVNAYCKTICLLFFSFISFSSFSIEGTKTSNQPIHEVKVPSKVIDNTKMELLNPILKSVVVPPTNHSTGKQTDKIEPVSHDTLNDMQSQIEFLKNEIEKLSIHIQKPIVNEPDNSMSFEVFTGILLASVALLVTILAAGIAIFSFFGYQKIISSTKEAAEKIAKKVAAETSINTTHEATKTELITLLQKGKFDSIINKAVEKVTFRGIIAPSDFDEEYEQNE